MEVFWIVVGVVAVIIYVINQNKTKISDRTVVNQNKTIKTEDGEITINRTQVIEHTSTQFQKLEVMLLIFPHLLLMIVR